MFARVWSALAQDMHKCSVSPHLDCIHCLLTNNTSFSLVLVLTLSWFTHVWHNDASTSTRRRRKIPFLHACVCGCVARVTHTFPCTYAYAYVFLFTYILLLNFQEGGVFTFGNGSYGQLGHNSFNHEYNPRKVTSTNLSLRCTALICNCSFKTNSEKEAMFCNCWGIGLLQQWVMRCSHP